jgi:hypothetical protein
MVENLNGINGKNRMDKSYFDSGITTSLSVSHNERDVTPTHFYIKMWNYFY